MQESPVNRGFLGSRQEPSVRGELGGYADLGGGVVDGEDQVAGDPAGATEVVGGELGRADQGLGAG